jgi:predicted HTH transcriptional regulator
MNQEQLKKLIANLVLLPSETETVEFKENNFNKEDIGKRISALSNSANLHDKKNAYLVFGIQDITHKIVGTTFSPCKEKIGNDQLEFWLSQHINPRIDFRIHEFEYDAKNIVLFEIPPAINQPVKFNNIAYIRVGSATPKLSDYPEKESKIWNNIHRNSFEKGIAKENVAISEILNLLDYSRYFSLTKQAIPTETQQFVKKWLSMAW